MLRVDPRQLVGRVAAEYLLSCASLLDRLVLPGGRSEPTRSLAMAYLTTKKALALHEGTASLADHLAHAIDCVELGDGILEKFEQAKKIVRPDVAKLEDADPQGSLWSDDPLPELSAVIKEQRKQVTALVVARSDEGLPDKDIICPWAQRAQGVVRAVLTSAEGCPDLSLAMDAEGRYHKRRLVEQEKGHRPNDGRITDAQWWPAMASKLQELNLIHPGETPLDWRRPMKRPAP